jgi:alpha-L-fucosidase
LEYYAFVHFGPNTFTSKEWGDGLEDPRVFAPKSLDTDQWCRVLRDAGMKAVILTAKHHDGFCLWPSSFSTHTVREAGFGRDVLRELSRSCRKFGLKFGVYVSPWDRNHPLYGTPEYNDVFVKMLTEVLTNYGEVFEVWFDGANGEGPNGRKQVYDFARFNQVVRKLQPEAVIFSDAGPDIRWVGNEAGYAGETCWGTVDRDRYVPGTPLYAELTEGKEGGTHWVPAECDVSIRKGWFWRSSEDGTVKSPEKLLDIWLGSVGRGSALLLNVPPDDRGLISDVDVKALMGFKKLREGLFDRRIEGRLYGSAGAKEADSTFWFPNGVSRLSLALSGFEEMDTVVLGEPIKYGQRVRSWRVLVEGQDGWLEVARGTTIGRRRVVRLGVVRARRVTVEILESGAEPGLDRLEVYRSALQ